MQKPLSNTMIYLLGFPGTGKYTIAKEIAKLVNIRIVDNHLINNPIFSLIRTDGKTKLPRMVWDYTDRIWEVVADTMVNLAESDESFILTNALVEGEKGDALHFEKIVTVAQKRKALLIPVRLCISSVDEHVRRITNEDRAGRLKETNGESAFVYSQKEVINPSHANALTLDVTHLSAYDAAQEILRLVRNLKNM